MRSEVHRVNLNIKNSMSKKLATEKSHKISKLKATLSILDWRTKWAIEYISSKLYAMRTIMRIIVDLSDLASKTFFPPFLTATIFFSTVLPFYTISFQLHNPTYSNDMDEYYKQPKYNYVQSSEQYLCRNIKQNLIILTKQ